MGEEEKLARDVYVFCIRKWGMNVFNNISKSEDTHTNAILALLKKYQITDPVGNNAAGVFTIATLQSLYNDLTSKGSASLSDHLPPGFQIMELPTKLNLLPKHF
ncbi:MAG: DUF2202 domain-containing protein [Cytophagaceae bacterium]|nr:DUF2202 domain-containing protein [Cytophagaceae bacterium]